MARICANLRSEYYEMDEDAKQEVAGEAELIIANQSNGPVGDVPLVFLKEFERPRALSNRILACRHIVFRTWKNWSMT
jgi:replicative DNA helicase